MRRRRANPTGMLRLQKKSQAHAVSLLGAKLNGEYAAGTRPPRHLRMHRAGGALSRSSAHSAGVVKPPLCIERISASGQSGSDAGGGSGTGPISSSFAWGIPTVSLCNKGRTILGNNIRRIRLVTCVCFQIYVAHEETKIKTQKTTMLAGQYSYLMEVLADTHPFVQTITRGCSGIGTLQNCHDLCAHCCGNGAPRCQDH